MTRVHLRRRLLLVALALGLVRGPAFLWQGPGHFISCFYPAPARSVLSSGLAGASATNSA